MPNNLIHISDYYVGAQIVCYELSLIPLLLS